MTEFLTTWLWENKIELIGALLGLLYIFFSIKQHILTWPTGLFTSLALHCCFFSVGVLCRYGITGLLCSHQHLWLVFLVKGRQKNSVGHQKKLPARRTTKKIIN
jgi:nicotinamide mononucleotide transporter